MTNRKDGGKEVYMQTKIINFQLFADGEGGGAAESTTVTDGANALDTAEATPADAGTEVKSREEEYAEYKEKFKDLYQKDFNSVFGKRFKGMKETEERLKSYDEDLEPLYKQYNVNNPKDLANAFL